MADIKIADLTYSYPENEVLALKGINLDVKAGEFVLLIGGSGSGKSTLMKAIAGLVPSFYGGHIQGNISLGGEILAAMDQRLLVQRIGMVFQDPESQLVMTRPEDEIAFGMENIGMPPQMIRRRLMEVINALSLESCRDSFIPELSGGQKQKVALASVLAMHPDILILDEPTSQLDPIAGEDILTMIRRLNEENGITIILSEQKLERCFHFADRIIVLEEGRVIMDSKNPGEIAGWSVAQGKPFIPSLSKVFAGSGAKKIPITIKEGRQILRQAYGMQQLDIDLYQEHKSENPSIWPFWKKKSTEIEEQFSLRIEELWFTYPSGNEVLNDVNLNLEGGTVTALIGANGSGKTTLLKQINGLLHPGRGKVFIHGENILGRSVEDLSTMVAYLSQDPNDYLFLPTVEEEVAYSLKNRGIEDKFWVEMLMTRLGIDRCKKMNPRDLSVGERQRVAFASVLATKPSILLLDEPTRGLDYELKEEMGALIKSLSTEGATVLMVTHDVEFIAEYCDEVILMDKGTVIESGPKDRMLANSTFYAPQISRLFHNYAWNTVTVEQGLALIKESQGDNI